MAFSDFSTNNFQLTAFGNAQISTAQKKYGDGSGYFDGNGDFLRVSSNNSLNFETEDFTVEAWVYPTNYPSGNSCQIAGKHSYGVAADWLFQIDANSQQLQFWIGGSLILQSSLTVPLYEWTHITVTKSAETYRFFVNGIESGSASNNTTITGTIPLTIGAANNEDSRSFYTGYIDDLRITKGIARYTSNFTPPQQQLPTTADPYYSDVSLLLPMNLGPFTDSSTNNLQLSAAGNVDLSKSVVKYGTASVYFDGNDDHIIIPPEADFGAFGTGNFTVEWWENIVQFNNGYFPIIHYGNIGDWSGSGNSSIWGIRYENNGSFIRTAFTGTVSFDFTNLTTQTNTWRHCALVRDGNNLNLFRDGVKHPTTYNLTANIPQSVLNGIIGGARFGGGDGTFYSANGYIDDLRITKGIARYTENFTPPQQQLLAPSDPNGNQVSLLLHMDGDSGSQTFTDSSLNNFALTAFGDAQISTTVKKLGSGSGYFDGSGDYLELPLNPDFDFGSEDFTIECWIYPTNGGTIAARWGNSQNAFFFYADTSNGIQVYLNDSYIPQISTGTILANTWQHVCLVRYQNQLKTFIDGVQVGTTATFTNPIIASNTVLRIAGDVLGNPKFNGYIDELRITKGVARYTENFVPHTAPFVNPDSTLLNNLLAYWSFDDSTPNPAFGDYPTIINGGTANYITGKYGSAIQLTEGIRMRVSQSLWNVVTNPLSFSVAFWFNKNQLNGSGQNSVIMGSLFGNMGFCFINSDPSGSQLNTGLRLLLATGTNYQYKEVYAPEFIDIGTWYHLAATYNLEEQTAKVYLNGVLIGTRTDVLINNCTHSNWTGFALNGSAVSTDNSEYGGNYSFDMVGFWDRVLTDDEVSRLYNNGNGKFIV